MNTTTQVRVFAERSKKLSPKCNPLRTHCNLTLWWIPRMILNESSRSHNTLLVITSNRYIKVITELKHSVADLEIFLIGDTIYL